MKDLEFKNDDPGAVKHGNFINYYQFNSTEARITRLPREIWFQDDPNKQDFVCLDVGCNTGNLTKEIYKFFINLGKQNKISFLGIDLDPILIERAREKNENPLAITYECLDFMSSPRDHIIDSFLKLHDKEEFDVIFCFSISMWIHLNHGDEGLKTFLKSVCTKSRIVVIEPQPWKCYKNALRRLKRAGAHEHFPHILNIKHNVVEFIQQFLENECKFVKMIESTKTEWNRNILFYKKNS